MTPAAFGQTCQQEGYGAPKQVRSEPLFRSAQHVHDQVSFVYVVEDEFIPNTADGAPRYLAGETCMLDKTVEHAEEAGKDGAVILVART